MNRTPEKKKRKEHGTLVQRLSKQLSPAELQLVPRSFDIIGSIAIVEVPKETPRRITVLIGRELLAMHTSLTSIFKKKGGHTGVFRTQPLTWIAGKRSKITVHKENGCILELDVEQCYFSPRMGTERLRITHLIQPGERILVLFSGIGAYPLVIAKNTKAQSLLGVEINPKAHQYAVKNAFSNKLSERVTFINADVRKAVKKITTPFDRVIMPMPRGGDAFLDIAIPLVRKNGYLHFYDFLHEDQFADAIEKIKNAATALGKSCTIIRTVKCGQQSPHVYRVCVDAEIH